MKFRKFGKALLTGALSLGVVLSVTSCVQSYTVGFLYVTGTQTSGTTGQGIISGFKIDHNNGKLENINGMPISSGGSYPGRAVLLLGSRFLYVLNQGGSDCTTNANDANCSKANIVQFSVSGNGALTPQQTFYTQGKNPFRIIADSTGGHIYVLDHDVPDTSTCALALGKGVTSCGDITAFTVDPTTGRLSLLLNAQVSGANGTPLSYFPVPANPIDFLLTSNYVLTLTGTPSAGDSVFPYAYGTSTGQLTISQNTVQPLNIKEATAIQAGNSYVYVLDNEPLTYTNTNNQQVTVPAQILPYTVGSGGALQSQTGGAVPDVPAESNPQFILAAANSKPWVYVANAGDNTDATVTNTQSGIAGYVIDTSTKQLTTMSGSPFGSGAGPACLVEDPSNQFVYTANFNDSSVTGKVLDQNVGTLSNLPGTADKTYSLTGPAAYCLVNGRTD